MSRITVDLAKATAVQLRDFLTTVKGCEVTGKETAEQLKAMLQTVGWSESFITAVDSRAPSDAAPAISSRFNRRATDRMDEEGNPIYEVRIMVQTTEKEGGDKPFPVGVNGRMMLVPRGVECWVPERYVEVLHHAQEGIYPEYDPERDIRGGLGDERVVSAYPFSYV